MEDVKNPQLEEGLSRVITLRTEQQWKAVEAAIRKNYGIQIPKNNLDKKEYALFLATRVNFYSLIKRLSREKLFKLLSICMEAASLGVIANNGEIVISPTEGFDEIFDDFYNFFKNESRKRLNAQKVVDVLPLDVKLNLENEVEENFNAAGPAEEEEIEEEVNGNTLDS